MKQGWTHYTNINGRSFIFILGTCALATTLTLAAAGRASNNPAPDGQQVLRSVVSATVQADSTAFNSITGIVQAEVPIQAAATMGGRIIRLNAQLGDHVVAGQVLAIVDGKAQTFRMAQAAAEVRRAQAVASDRQGAAQRAANLVGIGAMSEAEKSAAAAEAGAAQAALAAARANLNLARHDADQTVVRATRSGVVASRTAELGAVVAAGQTIFTIDNPSGQVILAAVPQKLQSSVRIGSLVHFDADGASGMARVTGLSPRIEDGGVAPVRLKIEAGAPAPGSIVRLQFTGSTGGSLVRVPVGAIQNDGRGMRFVYRLDKANQVRPVRVQLRDVAGGDARIQGDLPIGASIVAAGGAFVRPGQKVNIATPGA